MNTPYNQLVFGLAGLIVIAALSGCSRILSSPMPKGSISMIKAYNDAIDSQLSGEHSMLNKNYADSIAFSRVKFRDQVKIKTLINQSGKHFQRLTNPNIKLYVYPHIARSKNNQIIITGHSFVFPLYQHAHYIIQ